MNVSASSKILGRLNQNRTSIIFWEFTFFWNAIALLYCWKKPHLFSNENIWVKLTIVRADKICQKKTRLMWWCNSVFLSLCIRKFACVRESVRERSRLIWNGPAWEMSPLNYVECHNSYQKTEHYSLTFLVRKIHFSLPYFNPNSSFWSLYAIDHMKTISAHKQIWEWREIDCCGRKMVNELCAHTY